MKAGSLADLVNMAARIRLAPAPKGLTLQRPLVLWLLSLVAWHLGWRYTELLSPLNQGQRFPVERRVAGVTRLRLDKTWPSRLILKASWATPARAAQALPLGNACCVRASTRFGLARSPPQSVCRPIV